MRPRISVILYRVRNDCKSSGRNSSLWLFIKSAVNCNTYWLISLLHITYILCSIPFSRLLPYADKCTWHIFHLFQLLWKMEYNGTVHQLFRDFMYCCISEMREKFYSFFIEFDVCIKWVWLFKFIYKTYSKFRIDECLSDTFSFQNGLD